ncbi:unnamed protein product [Rhizoctonia solani]|nr:unnamed protein product [Rhizoctonia solani]
MWYLNTLAFGSLSTLALASASSIHPLGVRQNGYSSELKPVTAPIKILNSYSTIELLLGTPPQTVDLLFDTGSGPLWVLGPSCAQSCLGPANRSFFDPSLSSTAQYTARHETVDYLGGTVSGFVWSDKLTIQNVTFQTPQRFINADFSNWFALPAGGFVGLAFPSIALGNTSIYDVLFHPTQIPDHRTGIYLGNASTTASNTSPPTNGIVTFGGSDEEKYGSEPLKWVDVLPAPAGDEYEIWRVPVGAAKTSRNGNLTTLNIQPGASAIFDTGAGLISAPESIIEELYNSLGFNYTAITEGYRPLCSDVIGYNASLTLTFGEIEVTVTTADLARPGYTEDQYCFPPFNPWDSDRWILGKAFLQSFYSVWDLGGWKVSGVADVKPRLGLSYLKDEYQPRVSPV